MIGNALLYGIPGADRGINERKGVGVGVGLTMLYVGAGQNSR